MRRRDVIAAVGLGFILPVAAGAQPTDRMRRVGILMFSSENDPISQSRLDALRQGLEKFGWVEGVNVQLEPRYAAAEPERLKSYANELVSLAPDVIVAGAAPVTRALERATQTIPIVFVEATNGVGFVLTGALAHPTGNATGITNLYMAIGSRWLELLRSAVPRVAKVGLLFNPDFDSRAYLDAIEAAATAGNVETVRIPARGDDEIEHAIEVLAYRPDRGLIIVPPVPSFSNVNLVLRLATKYRLPAIYPLKGIAREGGLMAYGPDSAVLFYNSASYVDSILRGTKPSDLQIRFPTRFDLVINLKAARAIDLDIPQTLLARAAEVIE